MSGFLAPMLGIGRKKAPRLCALDGYHRRPVRPRCRRRGSGKRGRTASEVPAHPERTCHWRPVGVAGYCPACALPTRHQGPARSRSSGSMQRTTLMCTICRRVRSRESASAPIGRVLPLDRTCFRVAQEPYSRPWASRASCRSRRFPVLLQLRNRARVRARQAIPSRGARCSR
jgi:hypothetical protein